MSTINVEVSFLRDSDIDRWFGQPQFLFSVVRSREAQLLRPAERRVAGDTD
jgi:hypothetical protein